MPHPANPATRFLELKHTPVLDERELRRRSNDIRLEAALGWQPIPQPTKSKADAKSSPSNAAHVVAVAG